MRDDPARDEALKAVIRGPLTAMTALHAMPAGDAKEVVAFWVKALRPYPPEWVEDAFTNFAQRGAGGYPNPQTIIEIMNKRRGGPNAL